ncbi:hypothetical protein HW49_10435 [Porphyromonadaceae bacterium COT-184 OH4590]|nr:hypothetical protein HW49_10435 [Porphyromonadaceae bacterium COT-184 OH4590]
MPHDLINRLVFEIDLNCNENEAKTESDMLFEQHISSTLDRVLARYNHIDATFSDTIEIDLGSVPKADLGYKLEYTLSMIIEQYIGKTRYAITSLTNKTDKHSTAQTFLDYLHHPIIPWDTDNVTSFDRVTLIEKAIKEAMQSEGYFKQLLSAISSDIATCRRFFDLSFEQPHFSDIVTKIASSINESDSYVIAEKFKMLSSSLEANPQIFRDISYYIIANMLFANQQNNINIILLSSVLMVESGAVPKSYIFDLLANIANKYGDSNQSKYATHTNKKILLTSKESKSKLDNSLNNKTNSTDSLVSKELTLFTDNKTDKQPLHNQYNSRINKKILSTSKESKGKLDNSLNNKTNSTDSLVSKELILLTDNKTDKQPINNQYNSHINKKILSTSKESKSKLDNSLNNKTNSTNSLVSKELILLTDNKTDKQPLHNQYNSRINKKILSTSKESKGKLDNSLNNKTNSTDSLVSKELILLTDNKTDKQPINNQYNSHINKKILSTSKESKSKLDNSLNNKTNSTNQYNSHINKKILSTSKESKSKLDNSLNNKTNSTDSLVSKEPILLTDNKTDKQPINNQSNSHINKRILPTSKESKGDTDTPSSAKDNEMGDWSKSTDISEWQEAMHFIALIDKISQNPQIVTSDIEQVEEALSLLISKIDQLSFDKTDDNKHIISNLKTKSGQLSIEDIVKIAKAIGNTAIEHKQQANDHKQRLSKNIVDAIGKQPHLTERIPLYNAGLVLYNPFFISFFDRLELLENRRQFRSVEHQFRAVHLLQELSKAGEAHPEHILPLNKLLCGVNILFPVGEKFTPTDRECDEIESLSKAIIANWTIIKNSSIAGFQESFVRRRGVLERSDKDWILRVEPKGIDILLDDIPWNIHLISLPWNDYLIHVDWKL